MAKNKKKRFHKRKRKKSLPPLSKADKMIYVVYEVFGAIILIGATFGVFDIFPMFVLKNRDVLAFQERWTWLLVFPFVLTFLLVVIDPFMKKKPIVGNKKVDYYNTLDQQFALPLIDARYKNIEIYKEGRQKFFKKAIVWIVVFVFLFTLEVMGLTGRHEFTDEGITTYSVFNNPIENYSYDEVESYSITADRFHVTRTRGLGYTTYEINLTVYFKDGENFFVRYDFSRDIYAIKEIKEKLKGKEKTVDALYLEEFISRHSFSDNELRVIYELFDMEYKQ